MRIAAQTFLGRRYANPAHGIESFRRQRGNGTAEFRGKLFAEMPHQQREILDSVAQRRQMDAERVGAARERGYVPGFVSALGTNFIATPFMQ